MGQPLLFNNHQIVRNIVIKTIKLAGELMRFCFSIF